MTNKSKTIFLDIDGTIFKHYGNVIAQLKNPVDVLDGVKEKLIEWDHKNYNIILTTGRRESSRSETQKQLEEAGIFYDQLIMGLGGGERVVINDFKPNSTEPTASAICLTRNAGLKEVEI